MSGPTPPSQGPAMPSPIVNDPMFIWVEINRRISDLDALVKANALQFDTRLERMDTTGTRGVDGIRIEMRALRDDFNAHEDQHKKAADDQATARRWLIGVLVSVVVAVLANPFLVFWITRGR